jgi:hypothetical protein
MFKKKEVTKEKKANEPKRAAFIAKKNFKIVQNDFVLEIKVGDDLTDVPERFVENLKTEGVI